MRGTALALSSLLFLACSSDASSDGRTPDTGSDDATESDAPDASEGSGDEAGFGELGSLSQEEGVGSFRFGAATAAAQIEDGLTRSDWYYWTLPEEEGGRGQSVPIGDAVQGASRAISDVQIMTEMNLDAYRFSVDWSRIEPQRDAVSDEGLAHYDAFIDALIAAEIRPMITLHHFSSPIWVQDFTADRCSDDDVPTDDNLCGWGHPDGGALIVDELAEHAALLAREYGDRVDEWCTLNEPINYLIASHGVGYFPPGESMLLTDIDRLVRVFRFYMQAHVAMYDAIKENDTTDADGDGVAADVGFSLSIADWVPARGNEPSVDPDDIAAAERVRYVYHHFYPDALLTGTFDSNLDGEPDEEHPDWEGKLDWLGVQYYFRAGVTAEPAVIPLVDAMICFDTFDLGSCLPAEEESHWVPSMRYEYYEPGIYNVLLDYRDEHPGLPLVITEAGIAAFNGTRRAENVVRTLEQLERAMDEGVDVRGYYHWSLMDNFEWAEGYEPRFGLYTVDLDTYERTPTEGATVLGEIAGARELSDALRQQYGGLGPMSPETEPEE